MRQVNCGNLFIIMFCLFLKSEAFSALTLLVGWQEGSTGQRAVCVCVFVSVSQKSAMLTVFLL